MPPNLYFIASGFIHEQTSQSRLFADRAVTRSDKVGRKSDTDISGIGGAARRVPPLP
jgi:hypothetical protein